MAGGREEKGRAKTRTWDLSLISPLLETSGFQRFLRDFRILGPEQTIAIHGRRLHRFGKIGGTHNRQTGSLPFLNPANLSQEGGRQGLSVVSLGEPLDVGDGISAAADLPPAEVHND
jgi:hypothetical protein